MSDHLQHELKKEFQLERLILFSDAVFAIAITLLAIEIKLPEINRHEATDALLLHALDELVPKFVGFLTSFFIIGLYWTIHHRMFGYVVAYTQRLLWLNLIFLLAIVLMPFSTGFYSEYILRLLKTPVIFYAGNITFLGIMNWVLWRYVSNPKNNLVEGITTQQRRYFSLRAFVVPCMFIAMLLLYLFVAPRLAIWIPPLVPLAMRLLKRRYDKRQQLKKA